MQRINQPDRVSVDSFMDTTTATDGQFFTFVNHSPNTALVGAKKVHLLRASFPYIQLPLPDYQLVFYYHKLASATALPSASTLKAIRLYPRDWIPAAGFTAYTINQYVQTPGDLVSVLNAAASTGGDNVTYNTLWIANDITFSYDTETNLISFKGNDAAAWYCNAGYNDPFVRASQQSTAITMYMPDTTTKQQPYVIGYTLNLRCGFASDGINRPRYAGTQFMSPLCANLGGKSYEDGLAIYADSYADLNYTNNVYFYSNIVANSGFSSVNKKNLLGVIPVVVPLGGVNQYIGHSAPAYSLKVANEIYSIDIEMRDDANQPFNLPDSANVNVELGILYE
jgi:hypothetical protein